MLTPKLEQIKERIESRETSGKLSKEELALLKELRFLDANEEIQTQILLNFEQRSLLEMIGPSPDKCPACGRKF